MPQLTWHTHSQHTRAPKECRQLVLPRAELCALLLKQALKVSASLGLTPKSLTFDAGAMGSAGTPVVWVL